MLFSRINKSDAEKVWVSVQSGEALLQGRPVVYHWTGTSDGKIGWLADAAYDGTGVIGLADAAIALGAYGLVQVYGYRSDAQLLCASDAATNCGAVLAVGSASSGYLYMSVSLGAATGVQPSFILAHSVALSSTSVSATLTTGGVFIRCM
jgi:hypothetical protein